MVTPQPWHDRGIRPARARRHRGTGASESGPDRPAPWEHPGDSSRGPDSRSPSPSSGTRSRRKPGARYCSSPRPLPGPAHRLRQRRQPGAHAGRAARARARDPLGPRRRPRSAPSPPADRDRDPRRARRRSRPRPRLLRLDLLVGFAQRFTPRASEIRMDGGVLAFALVAATASALLFAFVPSLRGPEESGASLTRAGSRVTGASRRMQRGLIVAQVAATVAVLTAAGLLTRTLLRLYAVDRVHWRTRSRWRYRSKAIALRPRVWRCRRRCSGGLRPCQESRRSAWAGTSAPCLRRAARAQGGDENAGARSAEAGGGVPDRDSRVLPRCRHPAASGPGVRSYRRRRVGPLS